MEILYILLVILVVTRVCGELALRVGQPALVGEILGGVLLGVVVHRFEDRFPVLSTLSSNEVFIGITDLGVFFLMLLAGLEMQPKELAKASARAFVVALGGFFLPLAAGFGLGWAFLPDSEWRTAQALFIGTALAITAIPVAVKVLHDMRLMRTRVGKIIISAALFDDVLGLFLLAVLTALLQTGEFPSLSGFAVLIGRILLFFGLTTAAGLFILPFLARRFKRLYLEELEFSMLLVVSLLFSAIAEVLGLHFILGAFLVGLFFTRRTLEPKVYHEVTGKVTAVSNGFLAPVFFASIGMHLDLSALIQIPSFVVLFVAVAVLAKFLGAGLAARSVGLRNAEAAGVGVAMSARGALELIIANIALRAGLFDQPAPPPPVLQYLFSAVVIMAIATTLIMPIGLHLLLGKRPDPAPK
ncbi:MAG: cation:proton antiporter [Verrucomicrobiae bacterium]|nr:cation:proton antiporter [Verrucomicrobiae bacterium]